MSLRIGRLQVELPKPTTADPNSAAALLELLRRQLEAEQTRLDRVSLMGEMAASIAHDIRQPIAAAAINARTGLLWLLREQPDVQNACEMLVRIEKNAIGATEIVDRIRSLYAGGSARREPVDLNRIIQGLVVLLAEAPMRSAITIRAELDPELPPVKGDRVQLQQVLVNLMLNGIDAMQDMKGELTIASQGPHDGELQISVSDAGVGLPEEPMERLFEPFFTTKPQGTGMGLSISRKIIDAHGGRLWASANLGRGATFHFTLPTEN